MKLPQSLILTSIAFLLFLSGAQSAFALPVFPGAQGFGTDTVAGRGGTVYKVTNLNTSGTGSLKDCIDKSGPRVCVFEVSGVIDISGLGSNGLRIKNPYITIAGQTAPSPGIMLRGATFMIETHDVLIQHIRSRPGDAPGSGSANSPGKADSMQIIDVPGSVQGDVYNVIIDHCSLSWSMDETFSTWYPTIRDVTLRNCILSEPLHDSLHTEGTHGYTLLVGDGSRNVFLYGNLFAHGVQRNPLLKGNTQTVIANNLVYNYEEIAAHAKTESNLKASFVGNLYIKGPNSSGINPIYLYGGDGSSSVYVEDNEFQGSAPSNPWSIVNTSNEIHADSPPIWVNGFIAKPSNELKNWLLSNVGARPVDRDSVDTRIINDVKNGTGQIINCVTPDGSTRCQKNAGGWPNLAVNTRPLTLPNNPNGDDDNDGYTNLEEWLHSYSAAVEGSGSIPPPPTPTTCQSFTYSNWSPTVCPQSETQTRTITSSSPTNCTGGSPIITQSCTYSPGSTIFSTSDSYLGDSLNWQPLTPSRWSITTDGGDIRYGINTTNYSNLSGDRLGEYSLIKNRTYDDFTFQAKVKSMENFSTNGSADYDIVFGYQDSNNYYYQMFSSTASNSQLFKIVNGTRQLITDGNFSISDNNYHTVKLQKTSNTIQVYFDNTLKLTTTDSTFQGGQIGIGGYNDASLWDDITITAQTPTIQGDLNGDNTVNTLDWSIMNSKWNTNDSQADLNGDGVVNTLDWSIMNSSWTG